MYSSGEVISSPMIGCRFSFTSVFTKPWPISPLMPVIRMAGFLLMVYSSEINSLNPSFPDSPYILVLSSFTEQSEFDGSKISTLTV